MKRRILVLVVGLGANLGLIACGGYKNSTSSTNVQNRVVASQGVTTPSSFGGLRLINGFNDTIVPAAPLSAGSSPGLMALSPTHNVVTAFDASTNTVFAVDTTKETSIGNVKLPGSTSSMVVPTSVATGYAAVPSATVIGYAFTGAIEEMNFSSGSLLTIAVPNAQTVVANQDGSQLLVFSNDSNLMTVLFPGVAAPPVDTSCLSNSPNAVCTIVPGFDRPVFAVINGTTAYVLNCGPQCGGTQSSVMVFDLSTLTITNTIPVDAATTAWLDGSTLYVAGTSPTNHACNDPQSQAKICGRLDVVDLTSGIVTGTAIITDGYHDRMDMTTNGQLFIGSRECTNIGDVNNPSGEVRGCLSIYKTADGSVLFPPDNGNVDALQGFVGRKVEYVAEGGSLRVYDTTKDILLINDFVPQGTINVVGYVGDVKAIDFF
ncbi:MAG TPA: hypothetical protein VFO46_04260 [Candidatus Sulfotelmatobacter sp.]|nr:hypothetical protein [Candidatus Sulfotelmatobacter sp.]